MVRIVFVRHGESTENVAVDSGDSYDPKHVVLTDKGEQQASKTGRFLFDMLGKIDRIYCSPATRCIQTSNIISKQTPNEVPKVTIDELLTEIGEHNNPLEGKSSAERDKIMKSDVVLTNLQNEIKNEKNPYERYKLNKRFVNNLCKRYDMHPNVKEAFDNCRVLLDKLRYTTDKCIVIVTHGGIIKIYQRILCGMDYGNDQMYLSEKKFDSPRELFGNCTCMCVSLEDGQYKLISPANTYHLL